MTTIVTIGIDLAKNVFAVHGVDAKGKPALKLPSAHRAKLSRAQISEAALSARNSREAIWKAVTQQVGAELPAYRSGAALVMAC